MTPDKASILHVCSRDVILDLRDQILRLQGYEVVSTRSFEEAPSLFQQKPYTLVLVDIDHQRSVSQAEEFCSEVRTLQPKQKVAFVCNHRVSVTSDCPDEIIEAEFNPLAFVKGVSETMQ